MISLSHPSWMRGLKLFPATSAAAIKLSHPSRMRGLKCKKGTYIMRKEDGRIPPRMRGLKFNLQQTKDWPDISNGRQKDFEAVRSDWENVGTYIRKGTKRAAVAGGGDGIPH